MPMVTYLWVNLVTDTGRVREDILVFKDVPLCSSLTKTGGGVSLHQLKTVKFQQPKHPLQVKREITFLLGPEETINLNNHLIQDVEEVEGDPKEAKEDHQDLYPQEEEMNPSPLNFHPAQCLSTQILQIKPVAAPSDMG